MEAVIKNDAQPLYIVDTIYFPISESANATEADSLVEETAFAGMTDQEGQENNNTGTTFADVG